MIKIEQYKHIDRYNLEKLIQECYKEKKIDPPNAQYILDTISFYTTFPQAGKIYIFTYNNNPIGYAITINQWKLQFGGISCFIDEIYINKNFRKFKLEISLIEKIIKQEGTKEIEICLDKTKSISRKTMKNLNFIREYYPTFKKIV